MAERNMPPEMKDILSMRFAACFDDVHQVKVSNPKDLKMHGQSIFTPGEDLLLALGIDHWGLDDWHQIQRSLLCAKTVHQVRAPAPNSKLPYEWRLSGAERPFEVQMSSILHLAKDQMNHTLPPPAAFHQHSIAPPPYRTLCGNVVPS